MPNWCFNTLTIYGVTEVVDELVENVENDEQAFSIEEYYPTPEELNSLAAPNTATQTRRESDQEYEERQAIRDKMIEKYDASDWYLWRNKNWGTKWDVSDVHSSITADETSKPGKTTAVYDFSSPWGPPTGAIQHLSALYPTLYMALSFDEPGMDFGGYIIFKSGEEIDSNDGGSRLSSWEEISQGVLDDVGYYEEKIAKEKAENNEQGESDPEKEVV